MAHYADSNEGYKCNGARYYVEHITFNPDFVLSAEAHIQDGLKYIKPTTAYELNEKHFFVPVPEPATVSLALLALSGLATRRRSA